MNNSSSIKIQKSSSKGKTKTGSFLGWITQNDTVVVFGGFGIAIMGAITIIGMFQAGDPVRPNVLYNAFGALLMSFGFIYLIFKFMGQEVIIFDKTIDVGMIVYISIILFIIFVMGN